MSEWFRLSATELAEQVRAGKVTSVELVDAHIRAVRRVNPALNALVAERYDAARAEARAADERIAAADDPRSLPPYLGVPCTIKESFALTGMPNTAGLVARQGRAATEDAVTVARLRAAGLIPLGVTNTSELCMWMESANRVYGRTCNPYDITRTVGGSSGGEGAIVGSGASPFGLGSDIGGSIRMPAFFNGVFGHKPTGTLVPGSGQFPPATGRARRMLSTGPIARRARDLYPLLKLLAGPDGRDDECVPWELGDPAAVDLRSVTVWDVRDPTVIAASDELLAAQERAAEALARRGATVRRASVPAFNRAIEAWGALMHSAGGPTFAELLGEGTPVRPWRELGRWARGTSPYTLPALGLAALEVIPRRYPARTEASLELGRRLKRQVDDLLGDSGVMLRPSYARTAPRHGRALLLPVQWGYTAAFNVLESPVTQVPLGLGAEGLPLGVQVAGPRGRDDLTIAVALALEADLGGWVPPTRADTAA